MFRNMGKGVVGNAHVTAAGVAGNLVNPYQADGVEVATVVDQLQPIELCLVSLEVTPGHIHVLHDLPTLEPQEPGQLVG